jgi:hypothetical protein
VPALLSPRQRTRRSLALSRKICPIPIDTRANRCSSALSRKILRFPLTYVQAVVARRSVSEAFVNVSVSTLSMRMRRGAT